MMTVKDDKEDPMYAKLETGINEQNRQNIQIVQRCKIRKYF